MYFGSIKCIKNVFLIEIIMSGIHSATLKVIQGGRITIPQEVREIENIQEGDYVKVTIEKIERENKQ
jgi:AbrB family looped-hinge helix DNA binding protein